MDQKRRPTTGHLGRGGGYRANFWRNYLCCPVTQWAPNRGVDQTDQEEEVVVAELFRIIVAIFGTS